MAFYDQIHTTKKFRLGTKKVDIAGNVYIYMKGVASLAARDAVVFDEGFVTARLSTSTAVAQPVAIAMTANTASTSFSWFQIYGVGAGTSVGTTAADTYLQSTATAGQLDDTTTAGKTIVGMTAAAAGTAGASMAVWLNYPYYPNAALA